MSIPFNGAHCATVTPLPVRSPITDIREFKQRRQRQTRTNETCAAELRLLSERDPEFTNLDTEPRLRAALPHLDDESRQLTWELLVACQDKVREFDGDPATEQDYLDQLERLISDALDDDAEAAGR